MVSFTYPLTPPDTSPARVEIRPLSAVATGRSPITFHSDVQVYDGQMLAFDIEMPPLQAAADVRAWEQFFFRMNGRQGTCLYGYPTRTAPDGAYDAGSDTPVVDSAGSPSVNLEGDQVLYTRGWRNGGSDLLLAGDMLQLGSGSTASLHKVMTDVSSDGSGYAEIDIWPRLRRTPNDGATVTLASPVGLFHLGQNEMAWSLEPGDIMGFGFTLVEAIR